MTETPNPVPDVVLRNIDALVARKREEERQLSWQDSIAVWVARRAGSMAFVWVHAVIVVVWIAVNVGWVPAIAPFDPTLVVLAMASSVEAIFLSTFILINQNRQMKQADQRADLSLQISLLTEHELTRIMRTVSQINRAMNLPASRESELLQQDVTPEQVIEEMRRASDRDRIDRDHEGA